MAHLLSTDPACGRRTAHFCTTQWTLILRARNSDSPECDAALERLCQAYWYPLYCLARRKGCSVADAQDMVQGFFAALIEKNYLRSADGAKGKFRAFLQTSFSHFMANAWDRAKAQKRGGDAMIISIDAARAENLYALEPVDLMSPERHFDCIWAQTLLRIVCDKLRHEYEQAGELARYEAIHPTLMGEELLNYAEVGLSLGLSEGGVKTCVRRLRLRFGAILRQEIQATVEDEPEVEAEMRHLLRSLRS